jgi:Fe-S-cluster-containing hydrogenase component 2
MTWVVTRLCRDCTEMSCVASCPVSCIVRPVAGQEAAWPNQLFIDPDECIECGACEAACPWEAIYEDRLVPAEFTDDIALNARVTANRSVFEVPGEPALDDRPTPAQVVENRRRWGLPE